MKKILSIISVIFLFSHLVAQQKNVTIDQINREQSVGNFTTAKKLIDLYIAENKLSAIDLYNLNAKKDTMDRIAIDFNKDKKFVVDYIKNYYPDVDDAMLAKWESDKSLESMLIDGQKRYFSRAATNLFRINNEAREVKIKTDGNFVNKEEEILKTHLPEVVTSLRQSGETYSTPIKMRVRYKVTLKPNSVPDGEIVRCWFPYPREDNRRQTNVNLLSVNDVNYVITPDSYAHRAIYFEKVTEKDKPLEFSIEFSYSSAAEWFGAKIIDIKPYDTNSDLYKIYTAERESHVIFSQSIKDVSKKIVGNETDPYKKVQKIFTWISDNYPWAGAREYSTLPNIPQYVLENGHGDCGQVSLLFITLARYNGIPAKWQSGFMMHPNGLNLHDWAEVYFEGVGWIPVDQSFGRKDISTDKDIQMFYSNGIDAYRWIVNDDYSRPLFPAKIYPRSETVDFQRGELEWRGGNIYFDKWNWNIDVDYLN